MKERDYRGYLAAAIDTETGREGLYAIGHGEVIIDLNEMTDEQCEHVGNLLVEQLARAYPTIF
jgi:hypothetical protein